MSNERHRRFLFLDPRKAGGRDTRPRPPSAERDRLREAADTPAATDPARGSQERRRRLIPVVPLVAITIIVLIVVGSLVVELAVMPFVVTLPVAAGVLLVALAAAILLGAGWAMWWVWRGRPVQHPATDGQVPTDSAPSGSQPERGSMNGTRVDAMGRSLTGNYSGVTIAALIVGVSTCAPCAAVAPTLFTGWLQSFALYPWYVQVTSTLFVAALITLPIWAVWRVTRISWRRYSAGASRPNRY